MPSDRLNASDSVDDEERKIAELLWRDVRLSLEFRAIAEVEAEMDEETA